MITDELTYSKDLDDEIYSIIQESGFDEKLNLKAGKISFIDFLNNKMLMVFVIQQGIPYSFFDSIRQFTPLNENDWADLLNISTKSLQRYRQSEKAFKPIQSEKIIEMAEVTMAGLDLFGDVEKFKLWLETPNFALGKMKPIDLLKDSYGKDLVLNEITRIGWGIFA